MDNANLSLAALLNHTCDCVVMDEALLDHALADDGAVLRGSELLRDAPQLFSRSAVFVDARAGRIMREVAAAVERVVRSPSYRQMALAGAHPHALLDTPARGAFMGFDFHLAEHGPGLIEINTNAGGGLLNALLRRAQRPCCDAMVQLPDEPPVDHAQQFFAMFAREWQLCRGTRPLTRVAIVDDAPESQFLFSEFKLFVQLCKAHGVDALVCDARDLHYAAGQLQYRGLPIDLVYNRLTDFMLEQEEHRSLLEAFREDRVVLTPHPRAHALYADKRRLLTLSDAQQLAQLGASADDIALLTSHIPLTRLVTESDREVLWKSRKELFFKPHSGYGSKAAYRGDKLTKGVFEQILRGGYVAQALVPPSSRILHVGEEQRELKLDIRAYSYEGNVQLFCARLYSGQTTNFRTLGGGFAPVYEVP